MRVGVLGSGMVAMAFVDRLLELGHEARMGSRLTEGPAPSWAEAAGERASSADFANAAESGELVIDATAGASSLDSLRQAGAQNLPGKVLLDVANRISGAEGAGAGHFDGREHRQPGQADPTRVLGGSSREGIEHDALQGDGPAGDRARRARRIPLWR